MVITDEFGGDISSARVGDPLRLRILITDYSSKTHQDITSHTLLKMRNFHDLGPYQLFVRQLVALDGIDESEIVLIDEHGCPTDPGIMGTVERATKDRSVEAHFDAFKFPNSEHVRFRALVSPCVGACEPVHCYAQGSDGTHQQTYSYGRRRRSLSNSSSSSLSLSPDASKAADEMMVSRSLKVQDAFPFDDGAKSQQSSSKLLPFCDKSLGLVLTGVLLLLGQIALFAVWLFLSTMRKRSQQLAMAGNGFGGGFVPRPDSSLAFCAGSAFVSTGTMPVYDHVCHC